MKQATKQKCETTPVIFRVWREDGKDQEVFALFPTIPADNYGYLVTSYQHVGQHCSADYSVCIAHSRRAFIGEYADLWSELEAIGYENMQVFQRQTPQMRQRCLEAAEGPSLSTTLVRAG